MTFNIRQVIQTDHTIWAELFKGYIKFYKAELSEQMVELTWDRLLDPNFNSYCLVAEDDGEVLGITHYSFQGSTWAPKNYCYLEDLFVSPQVRGRGAGRALIDAVLEIAKREGSSRLYWNTDESNETARKLYDSYGKESGKVQYRIQLR